MSKFSRKTAQAKRPKAHPRVEALEDRRLPSATISGFVYSDANNNGIFDPGESPLANSRIELRNGAGAIVATAVSDASGHYIFAQDATASTAETTRTVTLTFASGKTNWSQAQALQQFDPALGTLTAIDFVNQGQITSQIRTESLDDAPATVTGQVSGTLTLSGPGLSLGALASTPVASGVAVQTFDAAAFDGVMDFAGASGHDFGSHTASGSQSLTLTDASDLAPYVGNGTVSLTERAQATSSASGAGNLMTLINSTAGAQVTVTYHYIPSNSLRPGTYTIVQASEPPGLLDGQDTAGNTAPLPNSVGADSIPVTLGATDLANNNFGEVAPSSLSGFVYVDRNNNGSRDPGEAPISGVTIGLSGLDDTGAEVDLTATTAADGSYHFGNLRPGDYTLKETQPAGYLDGQDSIGSQGGSVGDDQFSDVTLDPGTNGTNNNFGELPTTSISGFVYADLNNNGIKESGESGIAGATVTLAGNDDQGNSVSQTATTAADGSYSFTNLRAGAYALTETQPAGYLDGKDAIGTRGGTAGIDQFSGISLTFGDTSANNNFGELPPASLSGFVYADRNNNGVRDPADSPIPGVTIRLTGTDDLGNAVNLSMATATDGSYRFTGLRPGNYTIAETQPSGYLEGTNNVGSLGGSAGSDQFGVAVSAGANGTNYNFGELVPPPTRVTTQDLPPDPPPDTPPGLTKHDFLLTFWQRHGLLT